jgi:hypothetical protein
MVTASLTLLKLSAKSKDWTVCGGHDQSAGCGGSAPLYASARATAPVLSIALTGAAPRSRPAREHRRSSLLQLGPHIAFARARATSWDRLAQRYSMLHRIGGLLPIPAGEDRALVDALSGSDARLSAQAQHDGRRDAGVRRRSTFQAVSVAINSFQRARSGSPRQELKYGRAWTR